MKYVNMGQSQKDLSKAEKVAEPTISGNKGSGGLTYPYGLHLHLGDNELNKLGIKGMKHKPGQLVHVHAKARVTSTEERKQGDGNLSRNMSLQIEHLAMSARPNSALDAVDAGVNQANSDNAE